MALSTKQNQIIWRVVAAVVRPLQVVHFVPRQAAALTGVAVSIDDCLSAFGGCSRHGWVIDALF